MAGKHWTRDELLLALNLYYRIPFGRQHSDAAEVIQLARFLDRTPGSVAMKLNNLTSLDPDEQQRGVHGLAGASALDRSMWQEFHANWQTMTAESERLWLEAFGESDAQPFSQCAPTAELPSEAVVEQEVTDPIYAGRVEDKRLTRVRLAQSFFRRTVLAAYKERCCITGLNVPELLRASHIVPWSESTEHRLNPRNGLCLSALHDAAFDRHLITFTPDDFRLVLTKRLKQLAPHPVLEREFLAYEGKPLSLPERFTPDAGLIAEHHGRALGS